MRMVAMILLVAVGGISLMQATHKHIDEEHRLEDHSHHSHNDHPGDTPDCSFCALYAHFAPKEAGAVVSFTFSSPARPIESQLGQPRGKGKVPCKGPCNQYINKGPPAGSNLR